MHHGVEGKQTPHRAKGLCCHETEWSEGDRAQQYSQHEGKATRPSQKQPDTQREGPAKDWTRKPQGTSRRGKGSNDRQGGEPTAAKRTTEKRRPNHPQKGARRPRKNAQNRTGRNTDTTQTQPKRGRAREKAKHKTKDKGRQGEHSPQWDRTEPTHQINEKKGGPRGDRTPRRHAKGSPPHRSEWEQTAMWRPRKEATGERLANRQQNRGKRRRKGRVATSNSV